MTARHVLNEHLLMGYAAGILPEAFDIVVASKLCLCDESRAMLGSYEAVGGCLMEQCQCVPLSENTFVATMEQIKTETPTSGLSAPKKPRILPHPLQDYVGGDIEAVKWKSLGGGVKQSILKTTGTAQARLLFIPAGQSVPDHGHRGIELTLVLQGSFSDKIDHFSRGDIEIANQDLNHQPVAGPETDCICLAATDAPLRFNSLLPRLLQPFFKI
jgi:putative transcriptional regulator